MECVRGLTRCAQEFDRKCHQVIRDNHLWCRDNGLRFPMPCLFEDLHGCIPANTFNTEDEFAVKLWKVKKAPLVARQFCLTHRRMCSLFGPDAAADVEVAGLPCWDMSLAGSKRKEHGETNSVFMVHAKRHKEKRTPLLIIENVQAWP